ncbi:MAG: hypothetical protein KA116_02305, partial [Proteobacteria bacterium]|nr:hypothetical protein [Pseudomonadota bacterium]
SKAWHANLILSHGLRISFWLWAEYCKCIKTKMDVDICFKSLLGSFSISLRSSVSCSGFNGNFCKSADSR